MSQSSSVLAVTIGEPAGIGPELAAKLWAARAENNCPVFFLIAPLALIEPLVAATPLKRIEQPRDAAAVFATALPVLDLNLPALPPVTPGTPDIAHSPAVLSAIKTAVQLAQSGDIAALVTLPIQKATLYEAGFEFPGHTEFLAHLCGHDARPVMMLACEGLRVVPVTIHTALKEVPALLSRKRIIDTVNFTVHALKADFGIQNPRLAVAALNPHAGEQGRLGEEEQTIITPAIMALQGDGLNVTGPHPADTLFHQRARQNYDAAICMYHDQALIPLKTLDFDGGINITLNLPLIRTSPDHGTALDIAGRNKANPASFLNALRMAAQIAKTRANP